MALYRKKPVVIEATRIKQPMSVVTLEGTMKGNPGDWLITGIKGEHYFCRDDIFRETYFPDNSKLPPSQIGEKLQLWAAGEWDGN